MLRVPRGWTGWPWYALFILSASVLAHELGHWWAARRLGGRLDPLVLAPWGGLTSPRGIRDPGAELLVHLAGPAAQVAACLLLAPLLVSASGNLPGLLHPLAPEDLTVGTTAVVLAKLTFWLNWTLLLVNLMPVFPFDGGAALRAAILLKWPDLGRRGASWAGRQSGQGRRRWGWPCWRSLCRSMIRTVWCPCDLR